MKAAIYLDREGRLFLATFDETTPSHWDDVTASWKGSEGAGILARYPSLPAGASEVQQHSLLKGA
ncbi:MAG: hypothetical protein OXC19_03925 [Bryobacterales bacterium]|nr:hypothetical protein [Bryobacterales bacterium]